jgi:hypothetical protein
LIATRVHDPHDYDFILIPLPYGRIQMSLPLPPNDNAGDTGTYFQFDYSDGTGGTTSGWLCRSYTYIDYDLEPNCTYYYSAMYRNMQSMSTSFTNSMGVVTLCNPAIGLNVSDIGENWVTIEWDPNGNPVPIDYQIWMSTDNAVYYNCDNVTYLDGPTVMYGNGNLMSGTTYFFRILAVNHAGNTTEMDSGPFWTEHFPSYKPSMQVGSAMVYLADTGNSMLFGGSAHENITWTWSFGNDWDDEWPGNYPSGREDHAMAYDPNQECVILFGGYDATFCNDTYIYFFDPGYGPSGGWRWESLAPDNYPHSRRMHAMAYDRVNKNIVLFGGQDNTYIEQGDTWIYDGNDWAQFFPSMSPSSRFRHGMAFDEKRGVTVLFGGYNGSDAIGDTWEWDGSDWSEKFPSNSPSPREGARLAYDSDRERIVLYGGYLYFSGNGMEVFYEDVWEYDGADWLQVSAMSGPGCRAGYAFTYDRERQEFVLFGGMHALYGYMDDTWTMKYPDSPAIYIPLVSAPANLQNDWQDWEVISWSWTDQSNNEAGFELLDSETGQVIMDITAPDQGNTLEMDLDENTRYRRVVRCYTAGKFEFSDNSNEVEVVTLVADPLDNEITITPLPGGRMKLEIEPILNRSEGNSGSYFEPYNWDSGQDSSGWLCGSYTYVDYDLMPNTWYSYRAMYRGIEGYQTNYNNNPIGAYTRCNAPGSPNPWFYTAEEGRLQIEWGSNGNPGGTTYYIEMGLTPESMCLVAITTDLYYDNTSLWPDSTYFYRVSAQNMDGLLDPTIFDTAVTWATRHGIPSSKHGNGTGPNGRSAFRPFPRPNWPTVQWYSTRNGTSACSSAAQWAPAWKSTIRGSTTALTGPSVFRRMFRVPVHTTRWPMTPVVQLSSCSAVWTPIPATAWRTPGNTTEMTGTRQAAG